MTSEELQQLKEQLAALRIENERLKAENELNSSDMSGSYYGEPIIMKDTTFIALTRQLDALKNANRILNKASDAFLHIEKSMDAIVPALELQIKGLNTEIHQLKTAAVDTDFTYAGIVEKLEGQIKRMQEGFEEQLSSTRNQYEEEVNELKQELTDFRKKLTEAQSLLESQTQEKSHSEQTPPKSQGPFTTLSIFE